MISVVVDYITSKIVKVPHAIQYVTTFEVDLYLNVSNMPSSPVLFLHISGPF